MELVNTHCHTRYCGHGAGEVAAYAEAARAAGIATLAFTEHYPLTAAFDPDGYLSVPAKDMASYVRAVQDEQGRPGMEVLCGIELDYLGALEDRDGVHDGLDGFDLVLGSVHFVDGWPFDDPAQRGAWEEPGAPDEIWRRYVELWCEAAADRSLRFDVMSHPDLAKKFGHYPSFDLVPLYRRMADAANAGGRMVEVNTSGSYYACKEMFPAPGLLAEFRRAEVPVTVGTDAHDPAHVARDIGRAYEAARDAGYAEITVPTRGGGRRTIPL